VKIDPNQEIARIEAFLSSGLGDGSAVIALSGGLDSDVSVRLLRRVCPSELIRTFIAVQDNMNLAHLENARVLAEDIGVKLAEVDMRGFPTEIVTRLKNAAAGDGFDPEGLLDVARTKCALRTVLLSCYQDRGCTVIGTSNRSEIETGFFLPLGDGVWHLGPISHLYKSQVRMLAPHLGVRPEVLEQAPSAGFWEDETDFEDLSYWLANAGPIRPEATVGDQLDKLAEQILPSLCQDKIDSALASLSYGDDDEKVATKSGFSVDIAGRFRKLVEAARAGKLKPFGQKLSAPVLARDDSREVI